MVNHLAMLMADENISILHHSTYGSVSVCFFVVVVVACMFVYLDGGASCDFLSFFLHAHTHTHTHTHINPTPGNLPRPTTRTPPSHHMHPHQNRQHLAILPAATCLLRPLHRLGRPQPPFTRITYTHTHTHGHPQISLHLGELVLFLLDWEWECEFAWVGRGCECEWGWGWESVGKRGRREGGRDG